MNGLMNIHDVLAKAAGALAGLDLLWQHLLVPGKPWSW